MLVTGLFLSAPDPPFLPGFEMLSRALRTCFLCQLAQYSALLVLEVREVWAGLCLFPSVWAVSTGAPTLLELSRQKAFCEAASATWRPHPVHQLQLPGPGTSPQPGLQAHLSSLLGYIVKRGGGKRGRENTELFTCCSWASRVLFQVPFSISVLNFVTFSLLELLMWFLGPHWPLTDTFLVAVLASRAWLPTNKFSEEYFPHKGRDWGLCS